MSAVSEWDQVLRALVYEAYALNGTDEFEAACRAIEDAFYAWPLAEALHYLDAARQLLADELTERQDEELRWYEDVFSALDRRRTMEMAA